MDSRVNLGDLFFRVYFERSFMAPLFVRFQESRWAKFLCLRDRRWVRSLSDDITGNPGVVYLQQYAKTCTCLIERTLVISLSSGCNLGTVQRYLSTYYTEAGPSLDQYHYNDSLFPSSKVTVQSRYLSDGATRMLIILMSDTLSIPLYYYSWG